MLRDLIVFLALAFAPVTALGQTLEKVTLRLDYLNGGYVYLCLFFPPR